MQKNQDYIKSYIEILRQKTSEENSFSFLRMGDYPADVYVYFINPKETTSLWWRDGTTQGRARDSPRGDGITWSLFTDYYYKLGLWYRRHH